MSEDLADAMDMRFLYDSARRLFAIGYHVGTPLTFSAHYDLLASESRLASLVAIAKDDAPVEHWLALGRPYTTTNGQVLLSWRIRQAYGRTEASTRTQLCGSQWLLLDWGRERALWKSCRC